MSNYSDSTFAKDKNSSWFKAYNYITKNSTVLDIGCSSGTFGEVLINEKDCTVDGIEPDAEDFKIAKEKLRNVYKLNIESDDLKSVASKYDYIYLGDVIEHLVTPIPTLKRLTPLLKSEGKIVFSIPNMSHLSVRLMLLKGEFLYGETGLLDKTHLHFYTHSEVQRVFRESGYIISKLDPVLKDYPKELLEQELGKVGLKLTDQFIKFANSTEASVYQFVGVARRDQGKSQKSQQLDIVSPVDKFQAYLDETKKYYENIITGNEEHINKMQKNLEDNQALIVQKNRELDKLRRNPVLKLASKLKSHRKTAR